MTLVDFKVAKISLEKNLVVLGEGLLSYFLFHLLLEVYFDVHFELVISRIFEPEDLIHHLL